VPVAYIDIPFGLASSTKALLVNEVSTSLHDAYPIPDTRVFLREFAAEQTGIDGVLAAPFRPICDFIVPPGLPADDKRTLVSRVTAAVARACDLQPEVVSLQSGKHVSTRWVLSFFREVPLELAALDDVMAFENPMVIESIEGRMQSAGGHGA
jgi:phenylpyruvate tautomerase PptA (4-oxalocrotonate tautomerase family)